MRIAGLLIVAALAVSGAGPANATGGTPVTLPLKLGSYVNSTLSCTGHGNETDSYLDLDKKGFVTGFTGDDDNTFVAITNVGQNRYRIRYFYHGESNRRPTYLSDTWEVHSSTSFTIVGTPSRSYRYCGPKDYY